ncbi:iron-sulfur cluster carrier protein MrpORP [Candidatus Sumerlaeota bacterium]
MTEQTVNDCPSGTCPNTTEHSDGANEELFDERRLRGRMNRIQHKILVLSGKGGVGKSSVAVNLAMSLALAGKKVGLLDADMHGPSVPKLLGLEQHSPIIKGDVLLPVEFEDKLKVMSLGFLLRGRSQAVIWRGPRKTGAIKQFLKDVDWGDLDFLVIDLPPGTGDEPLSICQLIENPTGAVVVTTPQEIALADVRRSINFCRQLATPVIGVVENMSGFACPHCGETTDIFKSGAGEAMAAEMNVPFLGRIPLDSEITRSCDSGRPFVCHHAQSETAKAFVRVAKPILEMSSPTRAKNDNEIKAKENGLVKIAIPVADGRLAMHFGHCEEFALIDVDTEKKAIIGQETIVAPPHQPGLLPPWLAERGANVIIAGGMGARAKELFAQQGIEVLTGAPAEAPETIANAYLNRTLVTGENVCDH